MCPKLRQMTLGRDDEPPVFGVIHAGPSALSREAERPGQVLASRHERRMTSTAGLPSWNLDFFIWKIRQNDHPFFFWLPWRWQDTVQRTKQGVYC